MMDMEGVDLSHQIKSNSSRGESLFFDFYVTNQSSSFSKDFFSSRVASPGGSIREEVTTVTMIWIFRCSISSPDFLE
jgi:hypothetical protein